MDSLQKSASCVQKSLSGERNGRGTGKMFAIAVTAAANQPSNGLSAMRKRCSFDPCRRLKSALAQNLLYTLSVEFVAP